MQFDEYYRFISASDLHSGTETDYRTEYSRDYARVLHSPSFRRLQNKTQLFPGGENDFFRNRLTHSLEVSQISKSIAEKLSVENPDVKIKPEVCEIAGLLHDIGHPPFGHNGERALDDCMHQYGGFEGNAQTLRVITRLEKKERPEDIYVERTDKRVGLNLTARVIASIIKYDNLIPLVRKENEGLVKGYYASEEELVKTVKKCMVNNTLIKNFKTVECGIMDLADDIAYSTYDVEDAFKAGFLSPFDLLSAEKMFYDDIAKRISNSAFNVTADECRTSLIRVFSSVWKPDIDEQRKLRKTGKYDIDTLVNILSSYSRSKGLAKDGYLRTEFMSKMVNAFINGVTIEVNSEIPILSKVSFDKETYIVVNTLKHFSFFSLINSSRLKVYENRGYEIIEKMFKKLFEDGGYVFLPEDFKSLYLLSDDTLWRARVVCDFIAGMTDRYALEFYARLFSENPQTIFKPF